MSKRAREQRLQDLKKKKIKMTPLTDSIPMSIVQKASKPASSKIIPSKPKKILKPMHKWNTIDMDTITWTYKGEKNPKLVQKGKRKMASFLLEPMVVLNSELGPDGNLSYTKDPNKARYIIELGKGLGDAPKELSQQHDLKQEECLKFLDDSAKEALEYAFYEDLWGKKGELEPFLEGANHSWKKEGIQMKRRITTYGGESNRPTFWKKNQEGDLYEVLELDELPEGSVVQCQASMRFYSFHDNDREMYGSSLDLGDNILVLWMPDAEYTDNIYVEF